MSLRAILWALNDAPVEDAQRVLVLIGLADNARDDGTATWPSVATLAGRARCSARTVQRHLVALKADGIIREGDQTLVRSYRQDRRPVVYDVNLDAVRGDRVSPRESAETGTERPPERGDTRAPRGDADAPRGDSGAQRGDSDDTEDPHGVTPVTERGDTGVTQTVPTTIPEDQVQPLVAAPLAAPTPPPAAKGTRIPDTWPLDTAHAAKLSAWADEHAPAVTLRPESENWQDWHRAKGDTAKDWTASWRTWMRRAQTDAERGGRPGNSLALVRHGSARPSASEAAANAALEAGARVAARHAAQEGA